MKFYIIVLSLFLIVVSQVRGQSNDTLYSNNPREIADIVYGALDSSAHEGKLLNRSLNASEVTSDQLFGNYNQIHSTLSWGLMYDDVAISYFDTSQSLTSIKMANEIEKFFLNADLKEDDKLRQPFGLILQELNYIDSSKFNGNFFEATNHQLVPKTGVDEDSLYSKVTLKSAALLEFYPDNGYKEGRLIYDEKFISTSSNIQVNSLRISIDKENFQPFGETNNEIIYSRTVDSTIARVAIEYSKNGVSENDTLQFYITTKSDLPRRDLGEKAVDRWDHRYTWEHPEMKFRVAVKYGCGNGEKIRRPIIIAPPYRPKLQPVHMNSYYDQFDFKSLLSSLSDMGYDVIFIKEKPGNKDIATAGSVLAEFIKEKNTERHYNYPNEDFETILMGFSAGGQHARYALMKLEKEHMENGGDHHHTRLYIPFDSPHLGANVPMFAQSVFHDHRFNLFGALSWNALNDDASKDMLRNHYQGSSPSFNSSTDTYSLIPGSTISRNNLTNAFENSYLHYFSNTSDTRRSFPSFTRNIAVSTGRNDEDYTDEYSLTPGMKLFEQNIYLPSAFPPGFKQRKRAIYASNGAIQNDVYTKQDVTLVGFVVPIVRKARYEVSDINSYNWDMAQGGYKNEFYNKPGLGIIPIDPVNLLRISGVFFLGNKIYDNNMSFMPLLSALNINPSIWSGNNDLFYNVKAEGLMLNQFNTSTPSDLFGYPHLGNPTNHFNITPFEAVYADPQTYEHIKMQESVDDDDDLDDVYLVHLRDFILDEVEADIVTLQNQTIGQNHVQNVPYKYRAWYKAKQEIRIGREVTPKTNKGDYIIEATGDITVRAGQTIKIDSGFHAQAGSDFHAEIWSSPCDRPRGSKSLSPNNENETRKLNMDGGTLVHSRTEETNVQSMQVIPNPNEGSFQLRLNYDNPQGVLYVYTLTGSLMHKQRVIKQKNTLNLNLEQGIYLVKWSNGTFTESKKMIIR